MATEGSARGLLVLGLALLAGGVWIGLVLAGGSEDVARAAVAGETARLQEVLSERAALELERDRLQEENYRLTGELDNAMSERVAREEQFVQFTELISSIVPPEAPPEVIAALSGKVPAPETSAEPSPDELALLERSARIEEQLRTLLKTERLDSLDLLEAGILGEGHVGPVVFRILDESGRPIGSLSADRLRLEGSRAGRTLTILLEHGYERRGGEKVPFEQTTPGEERGGTRRIFLKNADPGPWFQLCPELFGPESLTPMSDDGRWHTRLVHRRLNELLGSDVGLGYYRLSALGGVMDDELRDVEVEQLDRSGRLLKRLFADYLRISLEERGVLLELREGIQMKGGHKFDFLGGRYRIFLPSAVQGDWKEAGLPGLVPSKESSAGSHAPLQVSNG